MAIDANTGTVLHNKAGDELRHPASLAKMMTLYMTFELIELGRLDYASKIVMTEAGAAATPSKLDLKPGEEISVLNAVKALITKSANDVAIALAERIGGTEANFARLMTEKARDIGMTRTVFRNASGLPDDEQVTTARDMLTLALRLQDDFPEHYKLFSTRTFAYGGKVYRNHNGLLARYRGTDGIKTGYTRASGFNLVTSVDRGGKRVVAAVFGGKTAGARNARMRSILDAALAKASTKVTRAPSKFVRPPAPVAARAPASPPPAAAPRGPASVAQDAPAPAPQSAPPATAETSADLGPGVAVARVRPVPFDFAGKRGAEPAREAAPAPPTATASASASATALPRFAAALPPSTLEAQAASLGPGAAPDAPPADAPRGPFAIQIGAYSAARDAEEHMEAARRRAGTLLEPYPAAAVPAQSGDSRIWRARFSGFEASAAASACTALRRLSIDCFVVRAE